MRTCIGLDTERVGTGRVGISEEVHLDFSILILTRRLMESLLQCLKKRQDKLIAEVYLLDCNVFLSSLILANMYFLILEIW